MEFTTLMSGSAGNCIYVSGGKTKLLVDIGCSCRYLEKALAQVGTSADEIDAVLITHEHSDHVNGIPVSAKRYGLPVYASELTWEKLPFADKLPAEQKHLFTYDLEIGELGVEFFKTSHDAVQPVGMVFHHQGQKVAIATDTGQVTRLMLKSIGDCDGLVFEANHSRQMLADGPYPAFLKRRIAGTHGHLSNRQSAQALAEAIGSRTQAVLLAHLSETNNDAATALSEITTAFAEWQYDCPCALRVAANRAVYPLITIG